MPHTRDLPSTGVPVEVLFFCVALGGGGGGLELRPAPSLQDLFVPWLAPLLTPLPASAGATDLRLCRAISVELCYSYLEACQAPCNPPHFPIPCPH